MSNFLSGTSFRVLVDDKTIAHETEASLSSSLDFKEVATKDTDGIEKTPGNQSWSISCNNLVMTDATTTQQTIATLYALHKDKTKVAIQFTTNDTGDMVFSGYAYIGTFNITSTNDENVSGDFSFEGTGGLTLGTVA